MLSPALGYRRRGRYNTGGLYFGGCGGDRDTQRADATFSHTCVPVADLRQADREVWVECDNTLGSLGTLMFEMHADKE